MRDASPRFAVVVAVLLLIAPAPARALEHLMVVQEVFPGTPAAPDAQYVMLRMTFSGQTLVNLEYVSVEDANGVMLGRFGTFDHDVPSPGTGGCSWPNCPAIVIGTSAARTLFGFTTTQFDQVVDAQAGRVALPLSGGRVCFRLSNGSAADCVAYGSFSAANTIPTPTVNGCDANFGAPAAALAPGYALTRLAFNCAAKENSTNFGILFPHPVTNNGAHFNVDADADGLIDVLDCADDDAGSWYAPLENSGDSADEGFPTIVRWLSQNATAGPATLYDVVAGDLGDLRSSGGYALSSCMALGVNGTSAADPDPDPPPGRGRLYLTRARSACTGTFGDGDPNPDPRDFLDDPVNGPCM